MNRIELIHKAGPFGDCTSFYELRIASSMTVEDFINEVLKKGEWGYIDIEDRRLEYRYNKMVNGKWDDIKDRKIAPVSAHGGWTCMDYTLKLIEK